MHLPLISPVKRGRKFLTQGTMLNYITVSFLFVLIIMMLETAVFGRSLDKNYEPYCPVAKNSIPLPFSHPGDCRNFFVCTNGTFLELRCPQDLLFDGYERGCRKEELVSCKSQTGTSEPAFLDCPSVNGKDVVMYPHAVDCSMYYVCDHGTPHPRKCPEGLHYNRKLRVCDYKHSAKCVTVVVANQ